MYQAWRQGKAWSKAFTVGNLEVYGGSWLREWPVNFPKTDLFLRLSDGSFDKFAPVASLNDAGNWAWPGLRAALPETVPTLDLDWPDGLVPFVDAKFWKELVLQLHMRQEGSVDPIVLRVACQGGMGRTGTALSIIYGLLTGSDDPITHVRKLYSQTAVEQPAQVNYVADMLGKDMPAHVMKETLYPSWLDYAGKKQDGPVQIG